MANQPSHLPRLDDLKRSGFLAEDRPKLAPTTRGTLERQRELKAALRLVRNYVKGDLVEGAVVCVRDKIMDRYTLGQFLDDAIHDRLASPDYRTAIGLLTSGIIEHKVEGK